MGMWTSELSGFRLVRCSNNSNTCAVKSESCLERGWLTVHSPRAFGTCYKVNRLEISYGCICSSFTSPTPLAKHKRSAKFATYCPVLFPKQHCEGEIDSKLVCEASDEVLRDWYTSHCFDTCSFSARWPASITARAHEMLLRRLLLCCRITCGGFQPTRCCGRKAAILKLTSQGIQHKQQRSC